MKEIIKHQQKQINILAFGFVFNLLLVIALIIAMSVNTQVKLQSDWQVEKERVMSGYYD